MRLSKIPPRETRDLCCQRRALDVQVAPTNEDFAKFRVFGSTMELHNEFREILKEAQGLL